MAAMAPRVNQRVPIIHLETGLTHLEARPADLRGAALQRDSTLPGASDGYTGTSPWPRCVGVPRTSASRISVSSLTSSDGAAGGGTSPRLRRSASLFIGSTTRKYSAAATIRKLMIAVMNAPQSSA